MPEALSGATFDAANRVQTWSAQPFTYDLNGNLASDGLASYTWNVRNQLTGISGGTSGSFAYDAVGRRRTKTIGATTTNFLYDFANAVQELSSGGTPAANLLAGLDIDEIFTRTDTNCTNTLLVDALGSTLALADATAAVQTQYTFDPFGVTTASGLTTNSNALQFTGRENDGTGLYYYRARYYDAATGRFTQEDPSGPQGGLNLYSYAGSIRLVSLTRLGWLISLRDHLGI